MPTEGRQASPAGGDARPLPLRPHGVDARHGAPGPDAGATASATNDAAASRWSLPLRAILRLRRAFARGVGRPAPRGWRGGFSALDDVHRQSAAAGFLVLVLHVATGVAHGLDDLVQGHLVL